MDDKHWMTFAIKQAKKAYKLNEVPVGSVLVINNKLIAKAHNKSISNNDASSHAEVLVIRAAGKKLANYRLTNATLYTTLEPCMMCLGAMVHARIERLVFATHDKKTGVCGSCANLQNSTWLNHKIKIDKVLFKNECTQLLQEFFNKRR